MRTLRNLALLAVLFLPAVPSLASPTGTPEVLAVEDSAAPVLQRREVERQLIASGLDPAAAALRVQGMTDAEIATLHAQMDQLPAGAGVSTTHLLLIIIILILLL